MGRPTTDDRQPTTDGRDGDDRRPTTAKGTTDDREGDDRRPRRGRPTTNGLSAVVSGCRLSAVGCRSLAFGCRSSVVGCAPTHSIHPLLLQLGRGGFRRACVFWYNTRGRRRENQAKTLYFRQGPMEAAKVLYKMCYCRLRVLYMLILLI